MYCCRLSAGSRKTEERVLLSSSCCREVHFLSSPLPPFHLSDVLFFCDHTFESVARSLSPCERTVVLNEDRNVSNCISEALFLPLIHTCSIPSLLVLLRPAKKGVCTVTGEKLYVSLGHTWATGLYVISYFTKNRTNVYYFSSSCHRRGD